MGVSGWPVSPVWRLQWLRRSAENVGVRQGATKGIEVAMPQSFQDELHVRSQVLHAAIQRSEGIEARIRRGELHEDLLRRSEEAAEAVVAARVALYRLLMEAGWVPPDTVVRDVAFDDSLGKMIKER